MNPLADARDLIREQFPEVPRSLLPSEAAGEFSSEDIAGSGRTHLNQ